MPRPVMRALVGLMLAAGALAACTPDVILPGTRFPVRAPLDASIPEKGKPAPLPPPDEPANQTRAIGLPAMVANAEWTQTSGNALHDAPHGSLSASPQLIWATNIGIGNSRRNRITASPVVSGGVVFVMDALAHVTAVSSAGAVLWQADLTAPFDRGGDQSGGGLAASSGRVYATTGYGEVVALAATNGSVLWRQRLGSPAVGAPTVQGNQVYAMSANGTGWAMNAGTGRVAWTLDAAPNVMIANTGASPAVVGNTVIFPFAAGLMMAAATDTGAAQWTAAITGDRLGRAYANSGDITGDPVVKGGVIYVGTQAGRTGAFNAATGDKIWTAEDGALNPPLVVGGSVFEVNDQASLLRLDATSGARIWAVDLPFFVASKPKKYLAAFDHFGPVLAGGRLVTVSSDGLLRQFDPVSGTLVGSVAIPGGAAADPALALGMLFVVTAKGQLLAFR